MQELIIDWENISKEQLKSIVEGLYREIEYYKKLLDDKGVKY